MRRMYMFRLYPTSRQTGALNRMLADHCELYNAALQERRDAYRKAGVSIRGTQQMAQLTEIRAVRPDQAVWSFTSQQQTLRRLDKAFRAFFRRVKAGQTPGYPRFRSAHRFNSVDFRHGDGIKFDTTKSSHGHATLRIQGIGVVKVRTHRNLPNGKIGQISVKREGHGVRARWHVVIPVEIPETHLPRTGREVGIDLGVTHLFTASEAISGVTNEDGHAPNPRHARTAANRLAKAQRALSRCKRGSNRRRKVRARVAALHAKVGRQRLDGARKAAYALVVHADVIVLEDLRIANMVRRAKPVRNEDGSFAPNGGSAKSGLNRSISDAGWGVLISCVLNKAEEAGREVVLIDPRDTSRRCAQCGHVAADSRATQAKFQCVACGHVANADVNAALNILRAGTARRLATA